MSFSVSWESRQGYRAALRPHDLLEITGRCCSTSAKRYPFTAGLLVRKGGFDRRGIRTKAAEYAVGAAVERLSEFIPWRAELIRLRA